VNYRTLSSRRCPRGGQAAVELAILAPVLAFLFLVSVDFSRLFYETLIVANCARNGALWASDPVAAAYSPFASVQQAALRDATDLSPSPTVTSTTTVDNDGNPCVQVTVSYQFQTIANYSMPQLFTIPQTVNFSRTVQMRVSPRIPN
jgi:Flp pilus assembly protein TadG